MPSPLLMSLFDDLERRPLSVSELTADVRAALESRFASVWVEGEISNFKASAAGHWYFTLKDEGAQLRASCFRNVNARIRFRPVYFYGCEKCGLPVPLGSGEPRHQSFARFARTLDHYRRAEVSKVRTNSFLNLARISHSLRKITAVCAAQPPKCEAPCPRPQSGHGE